MDDANQIQVPDSFVALFASRGGHRLTEPIAHVRARYELCEDLAQALTEQARLTQFQLGITEQDVLEKMLQALMQEGSAVLPNEAQWVVRRLAELLDWPPVADDLGR
jgi:hypothetical protein